MDISSILGVVANGATGGIFGGILGLGKFWMQSKHEDAVAKRRLELTKINNIQDLALMDKEAQRATIDAQIAYDKTDLTNLGESVKSQDKEIKALQSSLDKSGFWVNAFAGVLFTIATFIGKMVRPVLTISLMLMTYGVYYKTQMLMNGLTGLAPADLTNIYKEIITAILSLTGTAVGYWFVTRYTTTKK